MDLTAKLLKNVLNLQDIVVENCEFGLGSDQERILTVDVQPYKRLQHLCPQCGKNCPGYDRGGRPARTWRALDWGDVLVYLRYAPPRIQCPEHGVVTASVPWAYPGSRFTKDFDWQTAILAAGVSTTLAARLMRIDWATVPRCAERVKEKEAQDAGSRFSGLRHIAVNERSFTQGKNVVTAVFDREKNRLVWAHEGRASKVLEAFFEGLTADERASVEVVSGDNARAIDECIAKYAPQAKRNRR